jgi:DnaJ-class molecular chaperone
MSAKEQACPACDGTGLLSDDEEWQYTCSICGGDGIANTSEMGRRQERIPVDEMNRVLR